MLRKGEAPRKTHTELYDRITKIETEVLERIQKLKNIPKSTLCPHFSSPHPLPENYVHDKNYFDLYWKQFIVNDLGLKHLQKLQSEVSEMQRKMKKIEVSSFPCRSYSTKESENCDPFKGNAQGARLRPPKSSPVKNAAGVSGTKRLF